MKNLICIVLLVTTVSSANIKRQLHGCIYEGRTYQQGETWQKTCELNCVCQDASSGRYQCNSICPTYSDLPPSCSLVKAPGECCAKPQCNFQTSGQSTFTGAGTGTMTGTGTGTGTGTMTGTGTGTGTGAGTGTGTGSGEPFTLTFGTGTSGSGTGTSGTSGTCIDKVPNCKDYGTNICRDQSYAKWVEDHCCLYCYTFTHGGGTGMTGGTQIGTGGGTGMTGGTQIGTGGGTGMTGGTHIGTGSSGSCTDSIPNCSAYGKGVCSDPTYSQWVVTNCGAYCGQCGGMGTGTGTGTGTGGTGTGTFTGMTGIYIGQPTPQTHLTGGCQDKISNCQAYGTGACSGTYEQWARDNCKAFCHFCGSSGGMIGTVTYCADKPEAKCDSFASSVCQEYRAWAQENCPRVCGFCGGTGGTGMTGGTGGTGTGTGGTGTFTGGTGTGTGGTGTFTGGTGTGTGGTGTFTGGTGTGTGQTGGTGTMTGGCMDKSANCAQLDQTQHICSDSGARIYAQNNCPRTCNLCSGISSGVNTGFTFTSCVDKLTNCAAYGSSVCTDATYSGWVTDNCAKTCNKCSGTGGGTTGTGGTMGGTGGTMTGGTGGTMTGGTGGTMTGGTGGTMTGGTGGTMTGGNGIPTIGGSGTGSGGMTGHSSGCVYKTQVHQQGESWNDGCDFKCTCTDGTSGQYTCTAMCVTWQLPPSCTLNPPAPGKCCTTPSCPAGFNIQYPPGYQSN